MMPALLALGMIVVGTFVYHSVESWSWVDSVYFSATTLTTVGFGDLHPSHDVSKIFTIAYTLIGVGLMYSFVFLLANYLTQHSSRTLERHGLLELERKAKPPVKRGEFKLGATTEKDEKRLAELKQAEKQEENEGFKPPYING